MRIVTENMYKCQKCSLHLELQCNVPLPFCALVHRESHRSHTGQRFCTQDMLARLHPHKRMFDESSSQGWRSCEKGHKHCCMHTTQSIMQHLQKLPLLGTSSVSFTSIWNSWWYLQSGEEVWDIALAMLWLCPGAPAKQLSGHRWLVAFFPLAFLLAGNQERSCGRIWRDAAEKIPVSMGDSMLGQWAVMGKFPADLWRRSPWKSLEPPIWKEALRKLMNTIHFGSGHTAFVGWVHRDPPGICSLLWTIFPAQEHKGEGSKIRPENIS